MRSFFLALQFLTIFPYPKGLTTQDGDLARSMGHYSTIGALLGAALYLGDRLLWGRIPLDMINLLLLAALAILTGCLHWDGFGRYDGRFGWNADPGGETGHHEG